MYRTQLDLYFKVGMYKNKYCVTCKAVNLKTKEINIYRRHSEPRTAMNNIISYLENNGYSIYNVTFPALNIG